MRLTCFLLILGAAAIAAEPNVIGFTDAEVGKLPDGWTATKTGTGSGSDWRVVEDESAPGGMALAQASADGPTALFNLCVADSTSYADVDLTISFKAVGGKIDQGGGPVWRYQDPNNYYIARINPLENNYRLYKVVDGKRMQLATANVDAPANKWHIIRIVQKANQIQCYLNDQLQIDVKDDTFKDAGKIGLWTKADAQTRFAGLKVSGK